MSYLLQRLTEGDSHAGIAAAMQALAWLFPQYAAVFNGLTGVFAAVAVLIPHKTA